MGSGQLEQKVGLSSLVVTRIQHLKAVENILPNLGSVVGRPIRRGLQEGGKRAVEISGLREAPNKQKRRVLAAGHFPFQPRASLRLSFSASYSP
jgi:hypothetical protein